MADNLGGTNCHVIGHYQYFDLGGNFDDDESCPGADFITPGVDFDIQLANHGGPTETHALLAGSVAIDVLDECRDHGGQPLNVDQRGVSRPQDGDGDGSAACDSGAFELEEPLLLVLKSFVAEATTAGVLLKWETSLEFETVGFRILRGAARREDTNPFDPVSPLIPARGNERGANYEFLDTSTDPGPAIGKYYLEETNILGKVRLYGPALVVLGSRVRARTSTSAM